MKQNILSFTNLIFLILFLISYANADLPVHCLVKDIQGDWIIRIQNEKFDAKPEDHKTTCGHGLPDKVDKTVGDKDFSWSSYTDLELTLSGDYKVYEKDYLVGHWTPVYDQSFVVYYKNSILTAPYKYFKSSMGTYQSNCSKTMIGWYTPNEQEPTKNWSCFFAFKKGTQVRSFLQVEEKVVPSKHQVSFAQIQKTQRLHNSLKYEHLQHIVNEINEANLSWKAEVHSEFRGLSFVELKNTLGLKRSQIDMDFNLEENSDHFKNSNSPRTASLLQLSKIDKMGSELKEFLEKLNLEENKINKLEVNIENTVEDKAEARLNSATETKSGTKRISPIFDSTNSIGSTLKSKGHDSFPEIEREKDSSDVTDYKQVSKYLKSSLEEISEDALPKNWDWRNVGGTNYVPSIKRQGNCGSCYVFSSITCLESRLRIQTNNQDRTQFSKQYALSCNFYSEGCDGGYPFFVGKFFNEFEVVPESCFPYTQSNSKCSNVCDYTKNPKQYKVSHYGYIGGYYGATNEVLMMKELRARGPIPGNIRVPYTFNYYKSGVFSESSITKNADQLSKTTMVDRHLSWEKVEHSITIVGYGEEKGVKYWIGMNTWGSNWGDSGFFKILRGENDCSIESMGDVLQIEVLDRK
jgi:C1A family cysteine protease